MNALYSAMLLFSTIYVNNCYKILSVFPSPGYSQYILCENLMIGLAKRGHNVTVISAYKPKQEVNNYRTILVDGLLKETHGNFFLQEDDNIFNNIIFLYHLGYVITEYILSHNEVQNLINSNETFDLVIVEQFANEAHMGFAQHFNSPLITFSSLGHSEWTSHLVGNIKLPSIEPILFTSYTNRMSFVQRLSNSILNLFDIFYKHFIAMPKQQELLDKYFPSKLTLQEIMYNTSLLLMNSHSSTSHPTMLTTSVIEIGGFHITSNKLPVDIQKFLDESKEGAIFFSMGSNLKTTDLSNNTLSGILNVFSNMKQNVLWKFDGDSISNKPKNVLISKWLPQSDILAHPYTVGFITHGGMLSTTEAIFHGVPMVGIPIFGDQKLNVARSVEKGIAVHLPFKKLSETTLTEALVEILDNPKYKKNSKKLSSILRDRVVKPLDLAMYWVEYIGRHNGNPYSKNSALELYWFQLYLLDVIGFVILLGVILYCLVRMFFKKIKNVFCNDTKEKILVLKGGKKEKTK